MIREHEINIPLSREVYDGCSDLIERKMCYNNVFNVITFGGHLEKFHTNRWKVAYGYVKAVDKLMARHAFILDEDDKVIDPTLIGSKYFNEDESKEYISFKIFDFEEYLDAISANDNQPALFNVYYKEEMDAHLWAKERNMFCSG